MGHGIYLKDICFICSYFKVFKKLYVQKYFFLTSCCNILLKSRLSIFGKNLVIKALVLYACY